MIRGTPLGSACVGLVLMLGPLWCKTADAQNAATYPGQYAGLLADPGDYSFAPPSAKAGGVASVSAGSHDMQSTSIRMDSGLIGNTGMRGFVALEAGHASDLGRIGPYGVGANGGKLGVTSKGAAIGVEKTFTDGTIISLESDWQRDQYALGRLR